MLYRAINVVMAVVGVVVLVGMVMVGVNVYRAARTGPRWKRALITAGLVMLGFIGATSPMACCYGSLVAPQPYGDQDLQAVSQSLEFLDKQIANGRIQPDAARSTLGNIELNLERTASEEGLKSFPESDRARLTQQKNALQTRIDSMRKRVGEE